MTCFPISEFFPFNDVVGLFGVSFGVVESCVSSSDFSFLFSALARRSFLSEEASSSSSGEAGRFTAEIFPLKQTQWSFLVSCYLVSACRNEFEDVLRFV